MALLMIGKNQICTIDPENRCCVKYPKSFLGWSPNGIGRNLFFLFFIGLICFIIIFIKESKIFAKVSCKINCRRKKPVADASNEVLIEDSDVAAENLRIRNTNLNQLFAEDNLILRLV